MNQHSQHHDRITGSTIDYYTRRAHLERSKMAFRILDVLFGRRARR